MDESKQFIKGVIRQLVTMPLLAWVAVLCLPAFGIDAPFWETMGLLWVANAVINFSAYKNQS